MSGVVSALKRTHHQRTKVYVSSYKGINKQIRILYIPKKLTIMKLSSCFDDAEQKKALCDEGFKNNSLGRRS